MNKITSLISLFALQTVSKRKAQSHASGTPGGRSKSRSYAPASMWEDETDVSPTTTATTATTTTTPATARAGEQIPMESLDSNEVNTN